MTFLEFINSAKKLEPSEFYASRIAANNGIDSSWWPEFSPSSFLVLAEHAWIAVFPGGTCYTLIETEEYTGRLHELTGILYKWFSEDSQ